MARVALQARNSRELLEPLLEVGEPLESQNAKGSTKNFAGVKRNSTLNKNVLKIKRLALSDCLRNALNIYVMHLHLRVVRQISKRDPLVHILLTRNGILEQIRITKNVLYVIQNVLVIHLRSSLVLFEFYLLGYEHLVTLRVLKHRKATLADKVLVTVRQTVEAPLNVLASALPAHERWVSALLRVHRKVNATEGLVARSTLQRTGLTALGTWSRSHWSGNDHKCRSV